MPRINFYWSTMYINRSVTCMSYRPLFLRFGPVIIGAVVFSDRKQRISAVQGPIVSNLAVKWLVLTSKSTGDAVRIVAPSSGPPFPFGSFVRPDSFWDPAVFGVVVVKHACRWGLETNNGIAVVGQVRHVIDG